MRAVCHSRGEIQRSPVSFMLSVHELNMQREREGEREVMIHAECTFTFFEQ